MPLPLRATELQKELLETLRDINGQIASAKEETAKKIAALPYPDGVTVYDMKTTAGNYVLADLLHAKALCLSALVEINKELRE